MASQQQSVPQKGIASKSPITHAAETTASQSLSQPQSRTQYILVALVLAVVGLLGNQIVLHNRISALRICDCCSKCVHGGTEKPVLEGRQSTNSSDHQPTRPATKQATRVKAPGISTRDVFQKDTEVVIGNTTYHPSFGLFPKGCRWRLATQANASGHSYQFWDYAARVWRDERPDACIPQSFPAPGPPDWSFYRGSPRTEVTCEKSHCMYTNLYYNNGRWYALVDGETYIPSWKFSRNQEIVTLHVHNASDFLKPVSYRVIPGDTILFDFIFFIHPTAIGHWWEMLGPLYSILKTANFKRPCDQFILLHLQRQHMLEWVRAMIAVTLGVGRQDELPAVLVQEETDNAWHQISERRGGGGWRGWSRRAAL